MKSPRWNLERVQAMAALPTGLFVQFSRAAKLFDSVALATQTARSTIAALTSKNFAETQTLTWDVADVYGVKMGDGAGWYLKITIDESVPEVAVISFHPLAFPLKTNGGVIKP